MAWLSIINFRLISIYLVARLVISQTTQYKRFEYKYSFKGPYIVLKDNSVPFWDVGGHAIASDDQIRLAPSLKARKGYMWTKNPVNFEWWEVEMNFRVSGSGRVGADGLAFWYATERMQEGDAFGSKTTWNGLGIFFDSFDNDGKMNNPYVYVILNDGTKVFDHDADGVNQQLGGCLRDFRNKPFPVKVKVEYYRNVLTILMTNGLTAEETPELCLRAENVFLPRNAYFGISAATGGLADDHDVLSFVSTSLHDQTLERSQQISQMERQKLEQQFREYNDKLEQQRQEYLQQHPEKAAQQQQQQSGGPGQFENPQDRALRQIFDGQQYIHMAIQQLNRRIDEVIGRQERTLSAVSGLNSGTGQFNQQPVSSGTPAIAQTGSADSIRRYEVDSLLRTQQELQTTLREVKNYAADIQTRIGHLQQASNANPASYQQAGQVPLTEIRDSINNVRKDTMAILAKPQPISTCPQQSCLSTLWFGAFVVIQTVIYVGYNLLKSSNESKSKKFY
ncbi:protein ERGIC-53-like [Paramacrobiotus metropolitanus]|uniref:protein ERGIC-53-like n=1 Tax=Paramacrobiotus metropolitanus TaxID=2943436 RepID=UPI0024463D44|nr:protein ERGIC-53-like [Paramacrobiotus metropolitanus]